MLISLLIHVNNEENIKKIVLNGWNNPIGACVVSQILLIFHEKNLKRLFFKLQNSIIEIYTTQELHFIDKIISFIYVLHLKTLKKKLPRNVERDILLINNVTIFFTLTEIRSTYVTCFFKMSLVLLIILPRALSEFVDLHS